MSTLDIDLELIKSQKERYFEIVLMHYLYYNIIEGHSRRIGLETINYYFKRMYNCLSKTNVINTENACFENYSYHPDDLDELKYLKEKIEILRENPKYKNMFHLYKDELIIDDDFSYIPKLEHLNNSSSPIIWLEKLLYHTKNNMRDDLRYSAEKEDDIVKKQKFIQYFPHADQEETIIEHICKTTLEINFPLTISATSEGIEISEENIEYGKMLAARIIPQNRLVESKKQFLQMANNFAFLLQTCKPGNVVFDGTFNEYSNDYESIKKEADMIFRRKYICNNTCWEYDKIGLFFYAYIKTTLVVKKDFLGSIFITDEEIKRKGNKWLNLNNISAKDYYNYFWYKVLIDYIDELEESKNLRKNIMLANLTLTKKGCE